MPMSSMHRVKKLFKLQVRLVKYDTTGYINYKLNTNLPFTLKGKYQFQFLIRQDSLTGKVFVKSFMDETEEFLLYDFNLSVGDKIKVNTNQSIGRRIKRYKIREYWYGIKSFTNA